jgi:multiple sugar transport system permease protein
VNRGRRRKRLQKVAIWITIAVVLVLFVFPIYWLFGMALKQNVQITSWPPQFVFRPTLENFDYILFSSGTPYLRYLRNSFLVALATTALTILAGGLGAYSLSRYRFRGRGLFMFWVLTARILPPVAIGIPLFLIIRNLGLLDTFVAVVLAHAAFILPMGVWIMTSFFETIPHDIEQAAKVDGASPAQAFFYITLPVSSPGIGAAAILAFIFSWNEFFYSLVLTGSGTRTMTVALAGFQGALQLEWGYMSAAAVITVLPLFMFVFLTQRLLVSGLTGGALK